MGVEIPSRVTATEIGQDLIADGASLGGDGVDRIVGADQVDERPRLRRLRGHISDVEDREVHGNAADDGNAAGPEVGAAAVREGAHETVRVTDADRCQPGRPVETMRRTIANGATS